VFFYEVELNLVEQSTPKWSLRINRGAASRYTISYGFLVQKTLMLAQNYSHCSNRSLLMLKSYSNSPEPTPPLAGWACFLCES
jgi:hypothetical protein